MERIEQEEAERAEYSWNS